MRSGAPAYWASSPDSSGPTAKPPMLAVVEIRSERPRPACGRAVVCSSDRCAVAVAVIIPTPSPETTRAAITTPSDVDVRNITAERASTITAGSRTRRRPSQSETCPARKRLTTTPTA